MVGPTPVQGKSLQSIHPFVPKARRLLSELSKTSIRAAQWIDFKWNAKYLKSIRAWRLCPKEQHQATWHKFARTCFVRLKRLRTGVGRFQSPMYKWEVALTSICEWSTLDQIRVHVILECRLECWSWIM